MKAGKPLLRLCLSALAIVVAGAFVYHLAARPTPRFLAAPNYDLIRKGMTERDLVALFGVPPGDYSTDPWECSFCGTCDPHETFRTWSPRENIVRKTWTWDDGIIGVYVDSDGKIVEKTFMPIWPEAFSTRLRRWCGLH